MSRQAAVIEQVKGEEEADFECSPAILKSRKISLEYNDANLSMCDCHCVGYCSCDCDRGGFVSA
jgi:hypothetical protein